MRELGSGRYVIRQHDPASQGRLRDALCAPSLYEESWPTSCDAGTRYEMGEELVDVEEFSSCGASGT